MTSLKDIKVITNKPHACVWCNETIAKNELAHYRVYIFQGCFNANWLHPECYAAAHTANFDEGWTPGMFKRGSTDLA